MGRVKKYSRVHNNKGKRKKSIAKQKKAEEAGSESDNDDMQMDDASDKARKVMTIAKRKQMFKKSKEGRREVKKKLLELKM